MIVLDTHACIWLVDAPERLGRAALTEIERSDRLAISTVSCWEVARLVKLERLALDREARAWIANALANDRCQDQPLTSAIAIRAAELDEAKFPGDPADRFIYATATQLGCRLATADTAITAFDPDRVVWD